jgi:hypothetical protein
MSGKESGVSDESPARQQEGQEPWNAKPKTRVRRLTRDGFLFLLGVAIIVKEGFIDQDPSEPLLYLAGLLTGLPVFLRLDERSGKK